MDEHKDKEDVPVGSGSDSTVTASGHVAGEALGGSETGVSQGQVDGSFTEGVVADEGGSCNGDDLMVEVLGSDVYVGGVCTSGGGDSNDEVGHNESVEVNMGSERNMRSSGGDGGKVGDPGSGEVGVLGGEALNHGVRTGTEGTAEEEISKGVAVEHCIAAVATAAVGSTGGETQVVHMEEAEVVAREDVKSQEVNVTDEKARDTASQNGIAVSLVGSSGSETQVVVEEVAALECVEGLGRGLVEVMEQERTLVDGGVDALNDLKTQKAGVSNDEVWNPGIETTPARSSETVENSSVQTQVAEEKAEVIVNAECLNPKPLGEQSQASAAASDVAGVDNGDILTSKVAGMEIDKNDESLSHSVEHLVKIEPVGGSTLNHNNIPAHSVSSSLSAQAVPGGEVGVTGGGLLNSDKDQFLKPEESIEDMVHDIAQVESITSSLPAPVVPGGEVAVTDGEGLLNSEKDQHFKPEESIEKNAVHDISQVELKTGQEMEVDNQINGAEQVGLDEGHEKDLISNTEVPEPAERDQPMKPDECLGRTATATVAPLSTNMEIEVEVREHVTVAENVVAADDTALLNPHIEVPNSVDMKGALPCSGNDQNSKTETMCRSSDVQVTDRGDIASMDTEEVLNIATELPGPTENDQKLKLEGCLDNSVTTDLVQSGTNVVHEVGVKGQVTDAELDGLHGGQDMEVEKEDTDNEQPKPSEEKSVTQGAMQAGSSEIVPQPRYELPPENEGVFSASDLVWGKVKSHPWWPGQIFDFMVASEKAMKYHKKDCFLVAYFGDRTFAWNEASSLKHFRSHFSQSEKQCNSEAFQNAVNSALEEVSRRVEVGLACSCIPTDVYEKIRFQIVENAGICQESIRRDGVDESASASSFESNKLLDYVKALAQFPSGGSDRLELVIAKAHLLAFYRLKGYCSLPEFQCAGESFDLHSEGKINLAETIQHGIPIDKDDKETLSGPEIVKLQSSSSHKRKHNLRDGGYTKMKERSLSDLMGGQIDSLDGDDWLDENATGTLVSPSSGKKRKDVDYHADDLTTQDGRKAISLAKVSNTTPKQSFKIGECIQRVANQLTGSTIVKCNSDRLAGDGSDVSFQSSDDVHRGRAIDPTEYSSLDELLSQLQLAAEDPRKEYKFLNTIVNFFSDFRNSVAVGLPSGMEPLAVDKVGGKRRKLSNPVLGSPETFEFDDMNDTYWTDRVIQNGAEEQASRKTRKVNFQPVVLAQPEKTPQEGRRPYSRKRYSQGNHALPAEKPVGYVDENAPAELVMNFSEVNSVPSETNLNKMFRRFGPLKESETEVDRESSRARVVFKRCSDAEVAFNSAGKFNIFGPILVNYQLNYTLSQLNYTPSIQFSASPSTITQDQDMQLVISSNDHEMHLDLSTHGHEMQLDLSSHDQMQLDLSSHDQMQLDLSTHDQMQLDLSTFEVNLV